MSKAFLVAGLGYGDEGKGATVDYLCRRHPVDLVVRYNGGSQAAHNVVTPSMVHHTFAQFGAGTLANDRVRTYLSQFMLVDPLTMMNEAEALATKTDRVWERTYVDRQCIIITPFHRRLNKALETARGAARHGSCGMGVGVAREWHLKHGDAVLLAGDTTDYTRTLDKLFFMRDLYYEALGLEGRERRWQDDQVRRIASRYTAWNANLVDGMPDSQCAVFEGAQGVLLDETLGEAPHNTWTDCTFAKADLLATEAGFDSITKIGCLRTYSTRRGAGPLRFEDPNLKVPEELHNKENEWQGPFRSGRFDFATSQQAVDMAGGVHCLALSHVDAYHVDVAAKHLDIINHIVAPIGILASGATAAHRTVTDKFKGHL